MVSLGNAEERLRHAVSELPVPLRSHIHRVEEEAAGLAGRHAVNEQRARVAALGHDLVRHLSGTELLQLASRYGVLADPVQEMEPILMHGPIAARIISQDFGYRDAEVLAGIDCHTTARPDMTTFEKVLFVADKVEPNKLDRDPALLNVKRLADEDLDAAVLRYLDFLFEQGAKRGRPIHPLSLEARNQLLRSRRQPQGSARSE